MSKFIFKQFSVNHDRSSMKVGVDAVLLGAWAKLENAQNILDIGTGCGVIALICAQRCKSASILAIDIDDPSVEEAEENFRSSPWSDRLKTEKLDFAGMLKSSTSQKSLFDHIISNPPFFNSGLIEHDTPRLKARHQGILSPGVILRESHILLNNGGRLSMIVPAEEYDELIRIADSNPFMHLSRATFVRGRAAKPFKRVLLEFIKDHPKKPAEIDNLTIHCDTTDYTEEYMGLTSEFYLKF